MIIYLIGGIAVVIALIIGVVIGKWLYVSNSVGELHICETDEGPYIYATFEKDIVNEPMHGEVIMRIVRQKVSQD